MSALDRDLGECAWRSDGTQIYAAGGQARSTDAVPIGSMRSPQLAELVVAAHDILLELRASIRGIRSAVGIAAAKAAKEADT